MSEKVRVSGESPRAAGGNSPLLPVANPNLDMRFQPKAKSQIPAAFYVV